MFSLQAALDIHLCSKGGVQLALCEYLREKDGGLGVHTKAGDTSSATQLHAHLLVFSCYVFGFAVLIMLEILLNLFSLDLQDYNYFAREKELWLLYILGIWCGGLS